MLELLLFTHNASARDVKRKILCFEMFHFPSGDVALFRAEFDANQENGLPLGAIRFGIACVVNLLQGGFGRLIALEFDDVDRLWEKYRQINTPLPSTPLRTSASQHAAAGVCARGGQHQIKQGVEIGFIALGFNIVQELQRK